MSFQHFLTLISFLIVCGHQIDIFSSTQLSLILSAWGQRQSPWKGTKASSLLYILMQAVNGVSKHLAMNQRFPELLPCIWHLLEQLIENSLLGKLLVHQRRTWFRNSQRKRHAGQAVRVELGACILPFPDLQMFISCQFSETLSQVLEDSPLLEDMID